MGHQNGRKSQNMQEKNTILPKWQIIGSISIAIINTFFKDDSLKGSFGYIYKMLPLDKTFILHKVSHSAVFLGAAYFCFMGPVPVPTFEDNAEIYHI